MDHETIIKLCQEGRLKNAVNDFALGLDGGFRKVIWKTLPHDAHNMKHMAFRNVSKGCALCFMWCSTHFDRLWN